jgi:hypothetical protein
MNNSPVRQQNYMKDLDNSPEDIVISVSEIEASLNANHTNQGTINNSEVMLETEM